MPDRGLLERSKVAAGPLEVHASGAPWRLSGVRLAQVTFEVARDAALSFMPCEVGRPVPCYARIVVLEAGTSPVGPLLLAALHVGGRFKLLPRNVLVDAVVSGPSDEVAGVLGKAYRSGVVSLQRRDRCVEIHMAAQEGELSRMELPALSAVDPSMLRWDPWLGMASVDGAPEIVEYSLRPAAAEAFLSKGATVETAATLPRSHPWRQLRDLNTISACYLEGDVDLVLPEAQQPQA